MKCVTDRRISFFLEADVVFITFMERIFVLYFLGGSRIIPIFYGV